MKHLLTCALLASLPGLAQRLPLSTPYVNSGYVRAAKIISAAEKGDAQAQFDLGMLHERGDVVPQNHKEAAKWFRMAANAGYAPAQMYLGMFYAAGKGVDRDIQEAVRLIRLAAEQNYTDAQFLLGGIYFGDSFGPHNYVESYKWFRIAAPKGNGDSSSKPLDTLVKRMTPEQVTESERLIEEFSRTHKN